MKHLLIAFLPKTLQWNSLSFWVSCFVCPIVCDCLLITFSTCKIERENQSFRLVALPCWLQYPRNSNLTSSFTSSSSSEVVVFRLFASNPIAKVAISILFSIIIVTFGLSSKNVYSCKCQSLFLLLCVKSTRGIYNIFPQFHPKSNR